ncbi:hypothetical protein [Rufibacter hautae]|uniref:Uncharacterized protein n=1 Tax=Rufibacter hautae TaxID=2595005 RepID=A0A5B6TKI6_9BACT|nr:hypothetical protein [Rufibacter hautae]KAA3439897.1 hypothetical protein FOA19_04285 [Rufibacter hautae]
MRVYCTSNQRKQHMAGLTPSRLRSLIKDVNPVDACLNELAEVRLTLRRQLAREDFSYIQTREAIAYAQDLLSLLETAMGEEPALVHAQIGLLEASVLSNGLRLREAVHTAHSCLIWLLKSRQV